MTKLLELPEALSLRRQITLFDDFTHYVDAQQWTAVLTDSGTAAVGDAAGGVLALTASDATVADNDEAYLHSTNELFLFAADRPIYFETRIQFTEAATDDANLLIGLMDGIAADALQDDGAGPKTSYSGAVFYKVDGETVWNCESSIGGSQTTTATVKTAGQSAYQTLRIEFQPVTSTVGEVRFFIDNELVGKHSGFTFTSGTEMQVVLGVKNGSENNESLNIDYVGCTQLR